MTYALWYLSFQDDTSNTFSLALVKSQSSLTLLCCLPFINELLRPTYSEHQFSLNPLNITCCRVHFTLAVDMFHFMKSQHLQYSKTDTNRIQSFPRFMFSVALHDVSPEWVSQQFHTEVFPWRGHDSVYSCFTEQHPSASAVLRLHQTLTCQVNNMHGKQYTCHTLVHKHC